MGLVAHLAGNILLGLAVGLVSYYGITDLQADASQAQLESSLSRLGVIADEVPPVAAEATATPFDWDGWEQEDLAYWLALADGGIFGRMVVPSLDLDVIVIKGTRRQDLQRGPGFITATDIPGPTGNCGIAGHRTTYGAPFRTVDRLEDGDTIQFYSPFRRYTYEVSEQRVVRPWQTEVIRTTEEPIITLSACHPPYSAAYRIINHGDLVEVVRLADGLDGLGE